MAAVVSIVAGAFVIGLTAMQLGGVWDQAINVAIPLMGVINACNACIHWHSNRKLAYFSAGAAVFIFLCAIVVLCL